MKSGFGFKFNTQLKAFSIAAICFFFATGCSFFGIRTSEEASYKVLSKQGQIELRQYDELVVVETDVNASFDEAGKIAFKRLFGYISGENVDKTKIAMTAPVLAEGGGAIKGEKIPMTRPVFGERQDTDWRYAFVLPEDYTSDNAPLPSNPEVKLSVIPAKKVAVIRYSGTWKEEAIREKSGELVDWIQLNGHEPESEPRFAGYDPPWTLPFLRRNEVMIDIK